MLPGMDGLKVLEEFKKNKTSPVLMLTALNEVDHRLEGFDVGADDYLGKPFELRELLARIKALGRRAYPAPHPEPQSIGTLQIDFETGKVLRDGTEIHLTLSELRTLEFLVMRAGRIVTRQQLEDLLAVDGQDIQTNTIDVHIHRLRNKVGTEVIQTRRGQGYLIEKDPPA